MTAKTSTPYVQRAGLIFALREIIDALDRRGRQNERAGEMRIARDALMLRREAAERLQALQRADDGYEGPRRSLHDR
jgi:hypothetical protein